MIEGLYIKSAKLNNASLFKEKSIKVNLIFYNALYEMIFIVLS